MDSKPWGFYQPFLVPVYAFYVVFAFLGGNKVTVNFKYWLKPYNLHTLCFASLMYTKGLILNQKTEKKNLVPYEVLLFHSLCVQVLLELKLCLTVLLLYSLSFKCHFCHALVKKNKKKKQREKRKEMHILRRFGLFFFQTHHREEIQRPGQVGPGAGASFSFVHLWKGRWALEPNSGKHLWPVRVAHIRPLCCRCVGLLPPTEVHSAMQSDAFLRVWQRYLWCFNLFLFVCLCRL